MKIYGFIGNRICSPQAVHEHENFELQQFNGTLAKAPERVEENVSLSFQV